jgi:hypothetical protein
MPIEKLYANGLFELRPNDRTVGLKARRKHILYGEEVDFSWTQSYSTESITSRKQIPKPADGIYEQEIASNRPCQRQICSWPEGSELPPPTQMSLCLIIETQRNKSCSLFVILLLPIPSLILLHSRGFREILLQLLGVLTTKKIVGKHQFFLYWYRDGASLRCLSRSLL